MRQDRKLGARAANWLSCQIRALGRYAQKLIADASDNLSDVVSKAALFWLSPSGRPIAIITFVAIIAFAVADTAYLSFRPRTSSLAVHVFDAQHQCTECAPGQWKVVASRVLIEGRFAYGTDPGCLSEDSFLHDAATIGRMIIFAPATLAIGSTIEAYDLEIVRAARNHYLGGTWLGRQLDGKDNPAAECAQLAIPIPSNPVPSNLDLGDRITIRGRSTKPKNSTLGGDFPEKSRSDRGKWYGCPTGGELRPCGSDFGADLRPLYKPAYTAAGNYNCRPHHDEELVPRGRLFH
ncbi:MAG: hypothetical protein JO212_19015 [Acetobacteraceae bacterium]|nr:hypothetical protein [Acetobacteraceae bacterium]